MQKLRRPYGSAKRRRGARAKFGVGPGERGGLARIGSADVRWTAAGPGARPSRIEVPGLERGRGLARGELRHAAPDLSTTLGTTHHHGVFRQPTARAVASRGARAQLRQGSRARVRRWSDGAPGLVGGQATPRAADRQEPHVDRPKSCDHRCRGRVALATGGRERSTRLARAGRGSGGGDRSALARVCGGLSADRLARGERGSACHDRSSCRVFSPRRANRGPTA